MMQVKTPKEIIKEADKLVPLECQKDARLAVATLLSNFLTYLRGLDQGLEPNDMPALSMLLYGDTGTGKSHLFKNLCKACGLQVITLDAANISATGYKGINLDQALASALKTCDSPDSFYNYGGVCIVDEADKMAVTHPGEYVDFNTQFSFLKLMEKDFIFQTADGNIPTNRILFVFTGAFSRLEKALQSKYERSSLGFVSSKQECENEIEYLSLATMDDFEDYGMLPELMGRIGNIFYLPKLTENDYIELIKGDGNSIMKLYSNLLGIHGVEFKITDEACKVISRRAEEKKQGARALSPIIHQILEPAFSEIYDDESITSITIIAEGGEVEIIYGRDGVRQLTEVMTGKENLSSIDLSVKLNKSKSIDILVYEILSYSKLRDKHARDCMHNILRAMLYFLKLELNPDDQNFGSIIKLMNCVDSADPSKTVMDILMEDAYKRKASPQDEIEIMRSSYETYKQNSNPLIEKSIRAELNRMQKELTA